MLAIKELSLGDAMAISYILLVKNFIIFLGDNMEPIPLLFYP